MSDFLAHLDTPCLVLDQTKLERNLARMASTATLRQVSLRPHLKTAKSIDVAHLLANGIPVPITVSTLREAEYFHAHGFSNLFYAAGLGPGKTTRAARLLAAGARLITMVDSLIAATAVRAAATAHGVRFQTVIEIDCGEHRGGLPPDSSQLLALAAELGEHFAGVATHGGQSYAARSPEAITAIAEAEIAAVRMAANRLEDAGHPCAVVSLGSSPTAQCELDLTGVTEVRAGVYMFWDLFQAGLGCCAVEDIALTVLTEVIGRPEDSHSLLIDAGAFALSKDRSTDALPPALQAGFGWVCDIDGQRLPALRVERVWQEHGLIVSETPLSPAAFPVGTRLRILPNHACPTAAAHDAYHVVKGGTAVVAHWPRLNGWSAF